MLSLFRLTDSNVTPIKAGIPHLSLYLRGNEELSPLAEFFNDKRYTYTHFRSTDQNKQKDQNVCVLHAFFWFLHWLPVSLPQVSAFWSRGKVSYELYIAELQCCRTFLSYLVGAFQVSPIIQNLFQLIRSSIQLIYILDVSIVFTYAILPMLLH